MEVLGPEITRVLENSRNKALIRWLMMRACDAEFDYYDLVIYHDGNYIASIKSGDASLDKMIEREIKEAQKQLFKNGRINKEKVRDIGRMGVAA